jgi:hypothetical protein
MAASKNERRVEIALPMARPEALALLQEVMATSAAQLALDPRQDRFAIELLPESERRARGVTLKAYGEVGAADDGATRLTVNLPSVPVMRPGPTALMVLAVAAAAWGVVVATGWTPVALYLVVLASFGLGVRYHGAPERARRVEALRGTLASLRTRTLASGPAPLALPPARPVETALTQHIPDENDQRLLSGAVPGSGPLVLEVRPGSLTAAQRLLGAQDATLGDELFDQRFIVRTNDVGFARAWLTAPLRAQLLELWGHLTLSIDSERLRVEALRPIVDVTQRQRAVALAEAVAGRARALLEEWQALAARLNALAVSGGDHWAADGSVRLVLVRQEREVIIDVLAGARRPLVTRARTARVAAGDPLVLWRRGRATGAWSDATGSAQLRACAPEEARLEARAAVVELAGLVTDGARLEVAVTLALALATQGSAVASRGPYR